MRARHLARALFFVVAGCQWVLPLHQGDSAIDGGSGDGSLPFDGNGQPESGTESGGGDVASGDAMQCNTAWTGNSTCDGCLNQMCCALLNQCFVTNPECAALEMCILQCAPFDFSCPQGCANMHPGGVTDYMRADGCSKQCNSACGVAMDSGSDGAVAGSLCNPSMGTMCAGGALECVPPPSQFQGTCRLPCQSYSDCSNAGLISNPCCFLVNPAINVCIPNADLSELPDGSTCN